MGRTFSTQPSPDDEKLVDVYEDVPVRGRAERKLVKENLSPKQAAEYIAKNGEAGA